MVRLKYHEGKKFMQLFKSKNKYIVKIADEFTEFIDRDEATKYYLDKKQNNLK